MTLGCKNFKTWNTHTQKTWSEKKINPWIWLHQVKTFCSKEMLIKRQVSGWNKLLIFEKRISNKRFSCTIYKEHLQLRKNVIQFSFYWNTITLQYCVSFCCITTWISHIIHIFPPSWASLSHPILLLSVITEHQAEHPMQQLPTSYFTYGSVFSGHMSSSGIAGPYGSSVFSFWYSHYGQQQYGDPPFFFSVLTVQFIANQQVVVLGNKDCSIPSFHCGRTWVTCGCHLKGKIFMNPQFWLNFLLFC